MLYVVDNCRNIKKGEELIERNAKKILGFERFSSHIGDTEKKWLLKKLMYCCFNFQVPLNEYDVSSSKIANIQSQVKTITSKLSEIE